MLVTAKKILKVRHSLLPRMVIKWGTYPPGYALKGSATHVLSRAPSRTSHGIFRGPSDRIDSVDAGRTQAPENGPYRLAGRGARDGERGAVGSNPATPTRKHWGSGPSGPGSSPEIGSRSHKISRFSRFPFPEMARLRFPSSAGGFARGCGSDRRATLLLEVWRLGVVGCRALVWVGGGVVASGPARAGGARERAVLVRASIVESTSRRRGRVRQQDDAVGGLVRGPLDRLPRPDVNGWLRGFP